MRKVGSNNVVLNPDTFEPELEVLVRVPLTPGVYDQPLSDAQKTAIGDQFIKLLATGDDEERQKLTLKERIAKQLEYTEQEISRVKILTIAAGFDCTTAIYAHVKQYRDALKTHAELLRMNLSD